MPRPQGGGSNRSSSSHNFNSRSSSGHRVSTGGSAGRPGQGSSGGFSSGPLGGNSYRQRNPAPMNGPDQGPFGGPMSGPGPYSGRSRNSGFLPGFLLGSFMNSRRNSGGNYPPGGYYDAGPGGYGEPPRRRSSSLFGLVLIFVVIIFCLAMCAGCNTSDDESIGASTYNREKIESGIAYNADCIVDEENFFDNPQKTGQRLKAFYDKTGVQPEIVIKSYDSKLKTDEQKQKYAEKYYDEHINNEDTFLYMYFADADPNAVGFMSTVNGKNVQSVMDDQAVSIFWDYMDSEWTSDQSTDDMFVDVYTKTADRIMTKSATSSDVAMRSLLVVIVIAVIAGVIIVLYMKHKRDREKAEETAKILATPLKTDDPADDDLVKKYGG